MASHSLFGTLCLRADARPETGVGHVMRCLALAQAWRDRGGSTAFVTATETPALLARLESEGCAVHCLHATPASAADAAETVAAAMQAAAAWIVADGYAFSPAYLQSLRRQDAKLLVIDDLAAQDLSAAQLIVNPNLQATEEMYSGIASTGSVMAGNRYALLRREFAAGPLREPAPPTGALRVVVTLGGSDPPNATGRILEVLSGVSDRRLEVKVIAGPANLHLEKLETQCKAFGNLHDVQLLIDPPQLAAILAGADVAISGAGTSCWELASLGVPLAVVVVAGNQQAGAEALAAHKAALYLGRHDALDTGKVLRDLAQLFDQPALRRKMSAAARALIDGRGTRRVAERMAAYPLRLRPVTAEDAHLLFAWANDPLTRRMSFQNATINWDTHVDWLTARLGDPDCRFHVALDAQGRPLGQARLDRSGTNATLSFGLAPEARGRGLAARLVRLAAVDSLLAGWCEHIEAWVRPENAPSMAAFRRAGYTDHGVRPDQVRTAHSRSDALMFSFP